MFLARLKARHCNDGFGVVLGADRRVDGQPDDEAKCDHGWCFGVRSDRLSRQGIDGCLAPVDGTTPSQVGRVTKARRRYRVRIPPAADLPAQCQIADLRPEVSFDLVLPASVRAWPTSPPVCRISMESVHGACLRRGLPVTLVVALYESSTML